MRKEHSLDKSLVSGDIGVALMQFLSYSKGINVKLGTKEEDRRLKIDMYWGDKPCQVKTDYRTFETQHASMELAEMNFNLKTKQFGGNRPGSCAKYCECGKQVMMPQPQPNVTPGNILQQALLDNCQAFIYVMIGVGIAYYDPKTLNTALWYWFKNHIGRDIENNNTWQIKAVDNRDYFSLNLLIPYKYLCRKQEVLVNKSGESYTVEPIKFLSWADVQNQIISETDNPYRENLMSLVNDYLNNKFNRRVQKDNVEQAFGIQLLHKPVY